MSPGLRDYGLGGFKFFFPGEFHEFFAGGGGLELIRLGSSPLAVYNLKTKNDEL
jgi:hypothetical protein